MIQPPKTNKVQGNYKNTKLIYVHDKLIINSSKI